MALKTLRFWGGMKFTLTPELQVDTTVRAVVAYKNPPPQVLRMPKLYWRTDLTEKNLITPNIEFDLTMPVGSSQLEVFVEYSTENITEYGAADYQGGVTVTLTADEYDPVLPGFGTKVWEFEVRRADLRTYNYVTMLTHLRTDPGTTFYFNYYRFAFAEPLRRHMQVTLLDLNGNPLSDSQNQSLLEQRNWGDPTIAGWPLFSGNSNSWVKTMPPGGFVTANNMTAVCLGVNNNPLDWTIKSKDCIIIPAGTKELRFGRKYLKATLSNALNAAKAVNPAITQLRDAFILDFQDAGLWKAQHLGRDNRFVPQSEVVVTMNTDP